MSKPLNIIFAGTPDFAAQHLDALIASDHNIVAVYCPPDKPAGRGKKLTACAVKQLAQQHDLKIEQPVNFKQDSDQQQLASYNADVMVVVAYGLLLPEVILNTPRLGCVNVHGSILPRWRGAAPIQRALEAGDAETGVTIMQMDKGLDTGDMLHIAKCKIDPTDTSASLYTKLAELGPQALLQTLEQMAAGTHTATPQNNALANYAHKLTKEEAELDWQLTASQLDRKIRAYQPWPFAQITYTDNKQQSHKIKVWQADVLAYSGSALPGEIISADKKGIVVACQTDALCFNQLQLPGKKALAAADILNGRGEWFLTGANINGHVVGNDNE
ncbi:methionyl-tRNA formyltransferase [Thalassotalea aquiviva]|uniref:methionyl-tRNA formyltransferase n=1 Tax=Thalassotalea aquiviva TaxID=3242415 RepID=UPI00352A62EF